MVNLPFQTVNLSFYVVLSIISDSSINKNSDKFNVCYCFSCKNQTQNNKFVGFVSIKLPGHNIHKNNYRLNDTNFLLLCCLVLCCWSKSVTTDP